MIPEDWICLFVFVALRPMSTAMVIVGRSVHLTTLFPRDVAIHRTIDTSQ